MARRLYLDSVSVAEAGFSEAFDDFSWPIHQQTYDDLSSSFIEFIEAKLADESVDSNQRIDLALSIIPIITECFYFASSYINVVSCERLNIDSVHSNRSVFFPTIVEHRNGNISASDSLTRLQPPAPARSIRRTGLRLAKTFRTRASQLNLLAKSRLQHPVRYRMTSNALAKSWISPDDVSLRSLVSFQGWSFESISDPPKATEIDHYIARGLTDIVERLGYESDALLYEFVRRTASIHMTNAKIGREKNYERFINTRNSLLLTGTAGGFESRLMSYVFHRNNLPVVRFSHGADRGLFDDSRWHYPEFMFTDTYIVHGRTEADQVQSTIDRTTSSLTSPKLKIFGAGSANHEAIHHKHFSTQPAQEIKNVMVVANSIKAEHRPAFASAGEEVPYIEWHRRLLTALSDTQYRVISKRHPKDYFINMTLFSDLADVELHTGAFTGQLDQADAFVFDFAASAFMEALCTDKPVVLVEFPHRKLSKIGRRDVSAVCTVVHAEYDEQNRIVADLELVLHGLQQPVDKNAREKFVHDYLLTQSGDIGEFMSMLG